MIPQFSELTQEEKDLMYQVPALATILIAGADDDIDALEKEVAEELTNLKATTTEAELQEYYEKVSTTFRKDLEQLISELPGKAKFRNPYIREQLAEINVIFDKVPPMFANDFYRHIKQIAKRVAEASGGVLGYLSVSKEEERALNNLEMILQPKSFDKK
ncbi:MAG: hypothetical protein GY827_10270 [Cytophagales bacterium]|nr:hypothetical protein [Cytophagales bacterium]